MEPAFSYSERELLRVYLILFAGCHRTPLDWWNIYLVHPGVRLHMHGPLANISRFDNDYTKQGHYYVVAWLVLFGQMVVWLTIHLHYCLLQV